MTFLGVDPGKDNMYWALLTKEFKVIACGFVPAEEIQHFDITADMAFVETMECYQGVRSSNPKDLLAVQLTAGRVIGRLESLGIDVQHATPKIWKGTVNKAVMQRRLAAIYSISDEDLVHAGAKSKAAKDLVDIKDATLMAVRLAKNYG